MDPRFAEMEARFAEMGISPNLAKSREISAKPPGGGFFSPMPRQKRFGHLFAHQIIVRREEAPPPEGYPMPTGPIPDQGPLLQIARIHVIAGGRWQE